jgi:hypothetical protein
MGWCEGRNGDLELPSWNGTTGNQRTWNMLKEVMLLLLLLLLLFT